VITVSSKTQPGTVFYLFLLAVQIIIAPVQGRCHTPDSSGYEIRVNWKPVQKISLVLAHYYGTEMVFDAIAVLDEKGHTVFRGSDKLHPGIYVIYDEQREGMVDFLVGDDQFFSIEAAFGLNDQTIRFTGSAENEVLNRYKQFMAFKEMAIHENHALLEAAQNPEDSFRTVQQLKSIEDSIQWFRDDLVRRYPGSLLSNLLLAMKEPVLPADLQAPVNRNDSLRASAYRKEHFWSGVQFDNSGLLYTPFFSGKLERYFSDIIERQPDTVIRHIELMLYKASANKAMTRYILEKLLFGAMQYQFKWEDAVFLHLFGRYLSPKAPEWLLPGDMEKLTEHAYTLMANRNGTLAQDILLPDLQEKPASMFQLKSDYTLLCFWDVTCGHCRETLPVLDSLYRTAWKKRGVRIYAVSMESEGNRDDWKQFVRRHQLEEWTHVYYSRDAEKQNQGSLLRMYNIWYYPSFYLLGKEHRLMAEKLQYPAIKDFMKTLLSNH